MTIAIRDASPEDRPTVLALVAEAFAGNKTGGAEEVDVVTRTWEIDNPEAVELVACDGDTLVGHVLAVPGHVGDRAVPAIAPLCVHPSRHAEGIGGALMSAALDRLTSHGWPLVLLLGDPGYYSRFGFAPAGDLGLHYPPVGQSSPAFQVRRLGGDVGDVQGDFRFVWEV